MDQGLWRRRWRRALLVAWFLRFVPFVRLVGLNGSMATGRMHEGSDIDFFIATAPGRIFTGRFLAIALVTLLGVRTKESDVAGRVCLNRFASDDFLDITPHNRYHADVFHNMIPLVSVGGAYGRYCQENAWMTDFEAPVVPHEVALPPGRLAAIVRGAGEWLLSLAGDSEQWFKSQQEKRLTANERAQASGSQIIFSDQEVRYHFGK